MRRIDPGMAYTAAILFQSERDREIEESRPDTGTALPWLAVLMTLGVSTAVFGLCNAEWIASFWNLM